MGYIFTLSQTLVSWHSIQKSTITLCTMEAEYMTMTWGCTTALSTIRLFWAIFYLDSWFFSDLNLDMLVFFLRGFSGYIKMSIIPSIYNLNWLINKISLFLPRGRRQLPNFIKYVFSHFLSLCFVLTNLWLFCSSTLVFARRSPVDPQHSHYSLCSWNFLTSVWRIV